MASIRTARVLAAAAALPLGVALFAGAAAADTGALSGDRANAGVATVGAGARGAGPGISATGQQQAVGDSARNENNAVNINGSAPTFVDQRHLGIVFTPLW
ncbi:hypothetical protein [Streptomyces physcomitrii]|uniref:Secreted protein n=1 Tax=Streptomyces physcomitrii TaxID=2724184 RepID=A0ABX1H4X3_9ACTN|nr:hypothetical protein [Streptomyces physcomitrii]NKI42355.1 hypothetical protein [Streptomyces physcomitrii]